MPKQPPQETAGTAQLMRGAASAPAQLAKFMVEQRTALFGSPPQSRLDIGIIVDDGLGLHSLRAGLNSAANITRTTLGRIFIGQMHLNPRQAIGQMPQPSPHKRFGMFSQAFVTLDVGVRVQLKLHIGSPLHPLSAKSRTAI
jgi:hypothetical protein